MIGTVNCNERFSFLNSKRTDYPNLFCYKSLRVSGIFSYPSSGVF